MAIGSRPIFVTSGTPTFTPKTLSKLVAWYRSDLGITISGSNVSAWKDQSGTGDANKNLTTDTALNYTDAPYQATFARFNNLPAIGQVATNNTIPAWKLVGGGNFTTTSPNLTPTTFYAVFSFENLAAIGSTDTCWFANSSTAKPNIGIGSNSPGSLNIRSNNGPSFAQVTPITEDHAHIMCATWFPTASNPPSSSTLIMYVDDYTNLHKTSVVASGPITSLSNIFIGSNATDGDPFSSAIGDFCDKFALAEVIIYNDDHSGSGVANLAKRRQIMQYLGARYNIDVEVPTITSITPNAGSGAGGDSITITGHGFTRYPLATVSSVTLDTIDATSITLINNTTITALSGVGTAGVGDVVISYDTTFTPATGPTSITLSNGWTYTSTPILDPTTLSLSGFWRANYTGAPWNGTATVGASSGRNMITNGADPTTGTAVNGFTPATNDKTKGLKNTGTALSSFISSTAGSGWALIKPNTTGTGAVQQIFSDSNAADSAAGLKLSHDNLTNKTATLLIGYGAANSNVKTVVAPTGSIINGNWNLIQWTFNNTSVRIKINGGDFTSTTFTSDTLSAATQHCDLGDSSATGDGWSGDILEVAVSDTVLSDTVFNNVLLYCDAQYGLFLDGPRSVLGTRLKCEFTGELGSYSGIGTCTDLIGGGLIGQDTPANRPTLTTTPGGHAVWDFSGNTNMGMLGAFGSEFVVDPLAAFPTPGTGQRLFYFIFNAGSSFPVGTDSVIFATGNEGVAISAANGQIYFDTNVGGFFSGGDATNMCDGNWHRAIIVCNEVAPLTTIYIDGAAHIATMARQFFETTEIGGFSFRCGSAGSGDALKGKAGRFGWAYTSSTFSGTDITNLDAALAVIINGG